MFGYWLEGCPWIMAQLSFEDSLDINDSRLQIALMQLREKKGCRHVNTSFTIGTEEPCLLVMSRWEIEISVEQMLEHTHDAFSPLTHLLANEIKTRLIYLNASSDLCQGAGSRQDLYVVEGNRDLVSTDAMAIVDSLGMFSMSTENDDVRCELLNVARGLTPDTGDTRTLAVMLCYLDEQDRARYRDPNQQSWDAEGSASRFQDDWQDVLHAWTQAGAKVQAFGLSLT